MGIGIATIGKSTGRRKAIAPSRRHVGKSRQELATERKYVSILRADLHRSSDLVTDLALEDSIARLAPALEEMRSAVHEYNGIVYREMGDGIFAVFGAPVADGLHAVMACFAALELLRRIEALEDDSVRIRIGVHSGLVVAGPRKLDYATTYDFDGPPLIMAERLQAIAEPGQALASEDCRVLAEGYIQFGAGESQALKGFAHPVIVHPIKGVDELSKWQVTRGRGTAVFVGREAELSHVLALGESAAAGAGRNTIVSGEPGVGKSRLVREALGTLHQRGWQSMEVECSPIVGHSPFALLKSILVIATSALGDVETAALKAELPVAQLNAMRIVLDGAAADTLPDWARLAARARERAIVEMAVAVVARRIGQQPALLLIEDVQWADEASAPALEAILSQAKHLKLFVLATARTGDLPTWIKRTSDSRLVLAPLKRDAGLVMLDQLLGTSPHLQPLKARILEHTGAMPLFIEEVCRGLVEAGRLTGSWGEFEPAFEETALGVPLTVQGVIASRIDRLSLREKRFLQIAAAIGPQPPSHLLKVLSGAKESIFRQMLTALLTAGMLTYSPEAGRTEIAFPHECVRQVAYDATLESDRVKLHKRILNELETEAAAAAQNSGKELAALMIHHAVQATEWARAAELATAVARRCFAQSAFADAKRHFELAMASVDKLPPSRKREATAIDLRIEARMAYGNLGMVSRWLDLAREAEARAVAVGDRVRRIPALAMRAAALNFCGAPTEAIEAGQSAVREAAESGDRGWLAYAEYGLGQAHYVAGNYAKAVETLERAYRRFRIEGAAPPPGGGSAQAALLSCMMICVSNAALGDDGGVAAAQARADEIASESSTPAAAIAGGFSRGVLLLSRDDIKAAEETLAQSLRLARQHEVHLFIPVLANQHGYALLQLGQIEDAREAFRTAHDESEHLGHRSAGLRSDLGLVLCDAASPLKRKTALEAAVRIEQSSRQGGYQPLELEALLVGGALLDALGEDFSASQAAAERMVARTGAFGTERDVCRMLARVLGKAPVCGAVGQPESGQSF
ncbi:AAA family ATPase [Bradyrhizobium sp. AUGA SZCCT0182]|uniref:ATP-binding protein n=1 Tax=Bradyrhizobium sp. AUGA SZCCT0182 TaxID=2807667 RepID=UPI001BAC9731|nr:AAA family ATPase [Bradyrhizobium sp. AUGA SZCCT0182]MBR1238422.1 AAA family ATPase [Bradyrhizobium sp. AUGA SZCCT0182]